MRLAACFRWRGRPPRRRANVPGHNLGVQRLGLAGGRNAKFVGQRLAAEGVLGNGRFPLSHVSQQQHPLPVRRLPPRLQFQKPPRQFQPHPPFLWPLRRLLYQGIHLRQRQFMQPFAPQHLPFGKWLRLRRVKTGQKFPPVQIQPLVPLLIAEVILLQLLELRHVQVKRPFPIQSHRLARDQHMFRELLAQQRQNIAQILQRPALLHIRPQQRSQPQARLRLTGHGQIKENRLNFAGQSVGDIALIVDNLRLSKQM
jgi:hypothetical protein